MSADMPVFVIYITIFAAAFLAMQAIIGAGRQATVRVRLANARLRKLSGKENNIDVIAKMRKSRKLNEDSDISAVMDRINKLVLQSGAPLGKYGIYIALALTPPLLAGILFALKGSLIISGIGFVFGLALPILVLKKLVSRRRNKIGRQLPEALDVIVRSLAAGHPVPVAMSMVAREMPDPIGSEFGIATDEISFGSGLGQGVQRMADRIGQVDFDLFAATVRLQERTGGNLAELLRSNANTIRDRQRMRLKIQAASSEGRMSALILNIAPVLLYIAVQVTAPDFYGEVKGHKALTYGFWFAGIWMLIGNLVMRKMINFKI